MEVKGFRVRSGKGSRDICMISSEDVANYVIEHYESGKTDEIVVKPIVDEFRSLTMRSSEISGQ